jgi:hypothetical protein
VCFCLRGIFVRDGQTSSARRHKSNAQSRRLSKKVEKAVKKSNSKQHDNELSLFQVVVCVCFSFFGFLSEIALRPMFVLTPVKVCSTIFGSDLLW